MQHKSIEKAFIDADYLLQQDQPQPAAMAITKYLEVNPDDPDALYLYGVALARLGLNAAAASVLAQAVAHKPTLWQAWNNLGNVYAEQYPEKARMYYKRAADEAPDAWEPLANLSNALCALGHYGKAVAVAKKCLLINPTSQDAHNSLGLARLHLGEWDKAWNSYARSYGNKWRKTRDYTAGPTAMWVPNVASSKDVVVIHGEQGPGDEFMFGTLLRNALDHAHKAGAKAILEVAPQTETLFAEAFGDHPAVIGVKGTRLEPIITWHDEFPAITHKLPFGSLPKHFMDTSGGAPFFQKPYLRTPLEYERMASSFVATKAKGYKMAVGIAWNGGSVETGWARRSLTPEQVVRICEACPEIAFFSLEYGEQAPDAPNLIDAKLRHHNRDLALASGFVDALDGIVTVTTTLVDMAGAMGVPATVLVPKRPDWRYSSKAGEDKMHWYKGHHIIRQKEEGTWEPEITKLISNLKAKASLRG
jgi:Flp pilus assembly protein TadD